MVYKLMICTMASTSMLSVALASIGLILAGCAGFNKSESFVLKNSNNASIDLSTYDHVDSLSYFDGQVSLSDGRHYSIEYVNSLGSVTSSETIHALTGSSLNLSFNQDEVQGSSFFWYWDCVDLIHVREKNSALGAGDSRMLHRNEKDSDARSYSVFKAPLRACLQIKSGEGDCLLVFIIKDARGMEFGRFILKKLPTGQPVQHKPCQTKSDV